MLQLPRIARSTCIAALSALITSLAFAANEINAYRAELDSPLSEADISAITTHKRGPKLQIELKPATTPEVFVSLGKQLPELRTLYIREGNEKIADLTPLASFPHLETLRVRILGKAKKNPVSITPLAHCPDLVEADFYGTPVTDVGTLASCTKLQALSLYMSDVDSIDFLAATPEITELSLYGFGHTFPNYEPVAKLTKLRKLDIYMNKQATDANLAALKPLTNLRDILMTGCSEATTLDFLSNCTDMEKLRADWCKKLTDIKAVTGMPKLTWVGLSEAAITDITPLSDKTLLRQLDLSKTKIRDLSPLRNSTKLKELILSETLVKDLSPLSGMTSLETLELKKTPVADLKPLAGMLKLETLNLDGSAVTDLSPLATLENLESLTLEKTSVTNLAPLHKLAKLTRITLSRTTPAPQIEALKTALPNLRITLN